MREHDRPLRIPVTTTSLRLIFVLVVLTVGLMVMSIGAVGRNGPTSGSPVAFTNVSPTAHQTWGG